MGMSINQAKKFKTDEPRLSKANVLQLTNYDWPGNVRELQNIIERSVIISQKGILKFDLPKTKTEKNGSPVRTGTKSNSRRRKY